MPRAVRVLMVSALATLIGACAATVELAPGADHIRLTRDSADVKACKVEGNIQLPLNSHGDLVDPSSAKADFLNQVVGFGGNVGLVTKGSGREPLSYPVAGIAYKCS